MVNTLKYSVPILENYYPIEISNKIIKVGY